MPIGKHQICLELPIEVIWSFVKDMDNWAPLVPGYIRHEKINDRQSKWEFKEGAGILKKKIRLIITIKEWLEPTKVTFDLKGINENFSGEGYFEAEALDKNTTRMTGYLDILAGGAMGPVVNAVLKTSVPKMGEEMTIAIAAKLEELKAPRI
jgi:carbon monoxide dehydrogenase subunit G